MEHITAKANEKIKYAVHLRTSSSFRNEKEEFFLEGARLCSDAAESGTEIVRCFFTEEANDRYPEYLGKIFSACSDCFKVSRDVSSRLADTDSSQGVFCICRIKSAGTDEFNYKGKYLALENIQDPSNIGAICRSSEALGLDGLVVSGGCDLYNPKALRSAMGSSLRLNVLKVDSLPHFLKEAEANGMKTLASVPRNDADDIRTVDKDGGIICCIGNEGNGLTEETINACTMRVTIPMEGRAESFNASVAASILAWELKR